MVVQRSSVTLLSLTYSWAIALALSVIQEFPAFYESLGRSRLSILRSEG
jgi:hypothetical protein